MESDLDKKLEEIMFGDMPNHIMSDDLLAKPELIKQAFKDAGYERIPEGTIPTFKSYLKQAMTGQEWYDRFKTEFVKDKTVSFEGDMLAIARRAAGIE